MKYMIANMAVPVAKLIPISSPMSLCISISQGIIAFCRGNTLDITRPGTIAHSYTNQAAASTAPTTNGAST